MFRYFTFELSSEHRNAIVELKLNVRSLAEIGLHFVCHWQKSRWRGNVIGVLLRPESVALNDNLIKNMYFIAKLLYHFLSMVDTFLYILYVL